MTLLLQRQKSILKYNQNKGDKFKGTIISSGNFSLKLALRISMAVTFLFTRAQRDKRNL